MENDSGNAINYKVVAGVLGSLLLILVGVIDRIWSGSSHERTQQFRETDQRHWEQIIALENRVIANTGHIERAKEDIHGIHRYNREQDERIRALEERLRR